MKSLYDMLKQMIKKVLVLLTIVFFFGFLSPVSAQEPAPTCDIVDSYAPMNPTVGQTVTFNLKPHTDAYTFVFKNDTTNKTQPDINITNDQNSFTYPVNDKKESHYEVQEFTYGLDGKPILCKSFSFTTKAADPRCNVNSDLVDNVPQCKSDAVDIAPVQSCGNGDNQNGFVCGDPNAAFCLQGFVKDSSNLRCERDKDATRCQPVCSGTHGKATSLEDIEFPGNSVWWCEDGSTEVENTMTGSCDVGFSPDSPNSKFYVGGNNFCQCRPTNPTNPNDPANAAGTCCKPGYTEDQCTTSHPAGTCCKLQGDKELLTEPKKAEYCSAPPNTSAAGQTCDPATGKADFYESGQISSIPEHHGVMTAIGCIPTNPNDLIGAVLKFAATAGGGISLLLMIFGALRVILSAGNPEAVKKGREQFIAAFMGLLFILFAVAIIQLLGVDILQIPGFKP